MLNDKVLKIYEKKKIEKSNQKILRKRFNCPTNGVRDGQTTRIS